MSETADRVKKIVVEHLGVEADKVTEDASFIDDLGADRRFAGTTRPVAGGTALHLDRQFAVWGAESFHDDDP